MKPETAVAIARLDTMTVNELRTFHLRALGEPTASRHKTWLVRRIAWRLQAAEEGGLSERALARAAELAKDAQLRERRPVVTPSADAPARTKLVALPQSRDPGLAPGTVLRREWKGRPILATVHPEGFEYGGTIYRSLSALATAVTGTKWNGHAFFGLAKRGSAA